MLIEPIALNWASRLMNLALKLSTFGCSSIHNNTMHVLQKTILTYTRRFYDCVDGPYGHITLEFEFFIRTEKNSQSEHCIK